MSNTTTARTVVATTQNISKSSDPVHSPDYSPFVPVPCVLKSSRNTDGPSNALNATEPMATTLTMAKPSETIDSPKEKMLASVSSESTKHQGLGGSEIIAIVGVVAAVVAIAVNLPGGILAYNQLQRGNGGNNQLQRGNGGNVPPAQVV
jgi:hypothetical protein